MTTSTSGARTIGKPMLCARSMRKASLNLVKVNTVAHIQRARRANQTPQLNETEGSANFSPARRSDRLADNGDQHCYGQNAGDNGDPEHGLKLIGGQPHEANGKKRSDKGANVSSD